MRDDHDAGRQPGGAGVADAELRDLGGHGSAGDLEHSERGARPDEEHRQGDDDVGDARDLDDQAG